MKKILVTLLLAALVGMLFVTALAETVEFDFVCYANEVTTGARAQKADSEQKFYLTQTAYTGESFPTYYTSRDKYGTVRSGGIVCTASSNNVRKSKAYHSNYTAVAGEYYKLGAFPNDGEYPGSASLIAKGRWTP